IAAELARIQARAHDPDRDGLTRRRLLWLGSAAAIATSAGWLSWRFWPEPPRVHSLAVLPFENQSNDPDIEYLCDGVAESLIRRLSRLSGLSVVARSTVFTLKNKNFHPRALGRELGVDAILSGRIAKEADRVHVTTALLNVESG